MDLATRIAQLEDLVRDAKSMPLSSSALMNRDEVLELIEQLKDSIPDEIKQARWIVKDREELLASHEEVVQRSHTEAARIVSEAEDEARKLKLEAEDYVDAKLAQLEGALQRILEDVIETNQSISRTIDQVQAGREKLRGSVPTTNVEIGPDVQMPMLEDEGA